MKRALMMVVLLLGLTCGVRGATELLTNTGFEVNTTGWTANGCSIVRYTSQFNSGVASCRAYNRNPANDGLMRNITTILNNNGPGYYTFSAYLRIASGSAVGRIQVGINDVWSDITGSITNTGWTKVSGSLYLTWSTLSTAMLAINTTDSLADLYVDDCSLQKTAVETPTFSPNGGLHIDSVEVSLACATEGATIGYTLDGSTPTTSSSVYESPLTLTSDTTVKAIAWKTDLVNSSVASADFIVTAASQVVMPTITPNGGTQNNEYDFVFRVASGAAGTKTIRAQIDDVDVGSVSFTNYVNTVWTNYFDVMIPGVSVAKGTRQLKVLFDTAGFNFNYLDLVPWPPKAMVIVVR